MRLAVISDIHANLAALEAVLDDIETKGPDASINRGADATSSPPIATTPDRSSQTWPRTSFPMARTSCGLLT